MKKRLKRLINIVRKNYLVVFFLIVIILVAMALVYKNFFSTTEYFYAKVRVDYPASYYSKPDIWLANSLKKGDKQYSLIGGGNAEILKVNYYPNSNIFNIFLTLKLEGNFNNRTKTYTFQRSDISTGSPITFNFSSAQVVGTVIDLKKTPFEDKYVDRILTLIWRSGYFQDFPYFYDQIKVGDRYFDGTSYIFEVLDKKLENVILAVPNYLTGEVFSEELSSSQHIILTAKVKVLEKDSQLIFGEDQLVKIGNNIIISTPNFNYNSFAIGNIEDESANRERTEIQAP